MGHTITIRLTEDLAEWLDDTARRAGVPQSRIVREGLARVRTESARRPFMRLAGAMRGPRDLSSRRGFKRP